MYEHSHELTSFRVTLCRVLQSENRINGVWFVLKREDYGYQSCVTQSARWTTDRPPDGRSTTADLGKGLIPGEVIAPVGPDTVEVNPKTLDVLFRASGVWDGLGLDACGGCQPNRFEYFCVLKVTA